MGFLTAWRLGSLAEVHVDFLPESCVVRGLTRSAHVQREQT